MWNNIHKYRISIFKCNSNCVRLGIELDEQVKKIRGVDVATADFLWGWTPTIIQPSALGVLEFSDCVPNL